MKTHELIIGIAVLIALAFVLNIIPLSFLAPVGTITGSITATSATTYEVYAGPDYSSEASVGVETYVQYYAPTVLIDGVDKTSAVSIAMFGDRFTYGWVFGYWGVWEPNPVPEKQLVTRVTTATQPNVITVSIPYTRVSCNPQYISCTDRRNSLDQIATGRDGTLTLVYTLNQTQPQPEPQGDIIAQIIMAITDFLASIGKFVSNLFG